MMSRVDAIFRGGDAMRRIVLILLCLLFLSLCPQIASAAPIQCFNFTQTGYSGGGVVTGSFCGQDTDGSGTLNSFLGEITSYSMSFSGSPSAFVLPFTHTLSDFFPNNPVGGLVYDIGTPFLGDTTTLPGEGIGSGTYLGMPGMQTYAYATGYGPTGNAFAFGIVQDNNQLGLPFTPVDHSSNYVVVTSVPEPGTLALFGVGLAVLAARRRCRRRNHHPPDAVATA